MKKIRLAILALALLFLVIAGWFYFLRYEEERNGSLALFGNVDIREVDIGFRVLGKLEALFVDEGDEVSSGQLIARLDKQPFVDEAGQAAARVKAAIASMENAEKVYQRRQQLLASQAVSQEDFDDALSSYSIAKANLEEARQVLAHANTNLRDTQAFAPAAATVLSRIREPGSVIKIGDPVFTLTVKNPIFIRAYVSEPNLGLIYPGMPAKVYTDTTENKVYDGHVGFISSVAEFTPKTVETLDLRTDLVYRLRIVVDNPDRGLRQGMPVTIKLHPEPPPE